MTPTIGRVVLYKLSEADVIAIDRDVPQNVQRTDGSTRCRRNGVGPGQVFPAQVVSAWGNSSANLAVALDGDCTYWATSRSEGDGPGRWSWPKRTE